MRAIWLIAYLIIVVVIAYAIGSRGPAGTTAAVEMSTNHRLEKDDLVPGPGDREKLVGQYLRQQVKPGDTIGPEMVSARELFPPSPNGIAAIVSVPKDTARALKLDVGVRAQICRTGGEPFGDPATVIGMTCLDAACNVMLKLTKVGPGFDSDTLANATLATANSPKPCK